MSLPSEHQASQIQAAIGATFDAAERVAGLLSLDGSEHLGLAQAWLSAVLDAVHLADGAPD